MSKKIIGIVITMLLFATTFSVAVSKNTYDTKSNPQTTSTDEWPMFQHDPMHTGYSTSTAPNTNETRWTTNEGYLVKTALLAGDSRLYVSLGNQGIYCFDIGNGAELWHQSSIGAVYATPALDIQNNILYVYSYSPLQRLWPLNSLTGAQTGMYAPFLGVNSSLTLVNGKLYFGVDDGKVYCYSTNVSAGMPKIWEYQLWGPIHSSPTVADGKVFIGLGGCLYCLDAEGNGDGTTTELWQYEDSDSTMDFTPVVSNGLVYIGFTEGSVNCFNVTTGAVLWSKNRIALTSPAVANGKVYIGTRASNLYWLSCYNAVTGTRLWNKTIDSAPSVAPSIADGKVYIGSESGTIYCFSANTGDLLWNKVTGTGKSTSAPTIVSNRLYIGSGTSLFCFGQNQAPLKPDQPSGPSVIHVRDTTTYSTKAVDPDRDRISYGWDWGDGSPIQWTDYFDSNVTASCSHYWYLPGIYHIKVEATDNGATSPWSDEFNITVINDPPHTPSTPEGPTEGLMNVYYTFNTSSWDREIGSVSYNFTWGDGTWGPLTGGNSNSTISVLHKWISSGTKIVKVQALDYCGAKSNWSDILMVTIINRPPNTPQIPTGPTEGLVGDEFTYITNTTDPDGQKVKYGWDWNGDGAVDQWTILTDSGVTVHTTHKWTASGTFNVTVKAQDAGGANSSWSSPLEITIRKPANLSIVSMTGVNGITVTVKSTGDFNVTNVAWEISIQGGLIVLPRDNTGDVAALLVPGATATFNMPIEFGIGLGILKPRPVVTATVICDEGASATLSKNATILFKSVTFQNETARMVSPLLSLIQRLSQHLRRNK